jgi:hypothetical protein
LIIATWQKDGDIWDKKDKMMQKTEIKLCLIVKYKTW